MHLYSGDIQYYDGNDNYTGPYLWFVSYFWHFLEYLNQTGPELDEQYKVKTMKTKVRMLLYFGISNFILELCMSFIPGMYFNRVQKTITFTLMSIGVWLILTALFVYQDNHLQPCTTLQYYTNYTSYHA